MMEPCRNPISSHDRLSGALATLRPGGDRVEGVFACTRKDRLLAPQRRPVPRAASSAIAAARPWPARLHDADADLHGRPLRGGASWCERPRQGRALSRAGQRRGRRRASRDGLGAFLGLDGMTSRSGGVPAGRLPRPRRARRLPGAPRSRGGRSGVPPAARRPARRRAPARRVPPCRVHPRGPPRLPRRPARAYFGGASSDARSQELALSDIRGSNSDLLMCGGDRARPRQDARVHLRR